MRTQPEEQAQDSGGIFVKCPRCYLTDLVETVQSEQTGSVTTWDCAKCGAAYPSIEAVQDELDERDFELSQKHEDYEDGEFL
jgi:translation initiation factor 2 beta subunit (eIF-2beta)/eIF-5